MSITDELRKWAHGFNGPWKRNEEMLLAIADRIDAEHESEMMEIRNRGWNNGYDEGFASADDWLGQHEDAMTEHGWIRLPKDADGEYIHVGDEMCGYGWPNGGVYCRAIVNEVTILVGPQDGAYRGWLMWASNECRHHHEPTVEDVLREFAYGLGVPVADSYIAASAAKLRLAGGEDA